MAPPPPVVLTRSEFVAKCHSHNKSIPDEEDNQDWQVVYPSVFEKSSREDDHNDDDRGGVYLPSLHPSLLRKDLENETKDGVVQTFGTLFDPKLLFTLEIHLAVISILLFLVHYHFLILKVEQAPFLMYTDGNSVLFFSAAAIVFYSKTCLYEAIKQDCSRYLSSTEKALVTLVLLTYLGFAVVWGYLVSDPLAFKVLAYPILVFGIMKFGAIPLIISIFNFPSFILLEHLLAPLTVALLALVDAHFLQTLIERQLEHVFMQKPAVDVIQSHFVNILVFRTCKLLLTKRYVVDYYYTHCMLPEREDSDNEKTSNDQPPPSLPNLSLCQKLDTLQNCRLTEVTFYFVIFCHNLWIASETYFMFSALGYLNGSTLLVTGFPYARLLTLCASCWVNYLLHRLERAFSPPVELSVFPALSGTGPLPHPLKSSQLILSVETFFNSYKQEETGVASILGDK